MRGLEHYILESDLRDPTQALHIMSTDGINKEGEMHLKLIHLLKTEGLKAFANEKGENYKELQKFKEWYSYTEKGQQILIRELLMKFDSAKIPKEQDELITKLT
jgi:hypothetical protein